MSERAKQDGTQVEADQHIKVLEEKFAKLSGSTDSSDLLEATLNAFDNTIVVTDPAQDDNPIIYVNKGFEELTGYSFDEVVGQNCRFLQGDDHDQPSVAELRDAVREGRFVKVELRNYRKDGSMFWNELYVTPVRDQVGELILFLGVQNDITELKESSEELERLQMAVENADESILITNANLDPPGPEIIYTNPAFTTLTGYSAEEVLGKAPRFLQGPKTDRLVLDRLRRNLERGEVFRGESVNYRKDGSEFINEWHISPVESEGEIDYWIATQRDVTERRALEREVMHASVKEQRRIARELHDSLGQELAQTVYHLRRLQRDTKGDISETLEAGLEQAVDMLKQAAAQTRDLSHNLYGLELTGSGLMLALEKFARTTGDRTEVMCDFTYEVPVRLDDPERAEHLYRIAQEACRNALKHAQANTIRISLTGSGRQRTLSVYDDGVGFSETSGAETSGIGLQTMRTRAKLIGAELNIEALEAGGTAVRCTFPLTAGTPSN